MFEKVNPSHPDKIADRIAGAIVDLAYKDTEFPRVAVEVLIGHGVCHIVVESNIRFNIPDINEIVHRIAGEEIIVDYTRVPQDTHLAHNQDTGICCGDNGIFKGVPVTTEQKELSKIARDLYSFYPSDGKFIIDGDKLVICQSNAPRDALKVMFPNAVSNPIGDWTGGTQVDTGATNRKLGSDMGDSITGGGLHGKDLSKADISVNIYAWLEAQRTGKPVEFSCAIGDTVVGGVSYYNIMSIARKFIRDIGGFEKFAEWGLI